MVGLDIKIWYLIFVLTFSNGEAIVVVNQQPFYSQESCVKRIEEIPRKSDLLENLKDEKRFCIGLRDTKNT